MTPVITAAEDEDAPPLAPTPLFQSDAEGPTALLQFATMAAAKAPVPGLALRDMVMVVEDDLEEDVGGEEGDIVAGDLEKGAVEAV